MKKTMNTFLMVIVLSVGLLPSKPVFAQEKIIFRNVTVENIYPDGIIIRVEICGRPQDSRVYFNYKYPGNWDAYWWSIDEWTLDEGQTQDDCDKRKVFLETKELSLPPFSPIRFYWSVSSQDKEISKSVNYIHYYKNDAFDWMSYKDEEIVVWWHDRPIEFGENIHSIAQTAINDQALYYGRTLTDPVTIVIFNSKDEFFGWQTEENYYAGYAFTKISLTAQVITSEDGQSNWVQEVIPHEISHIYFNQLSSRMSGYVKWLNEGLATYNEYGNHFHEWTLLKDGYEEGKLTPFRHLARSFSDDPARVSLAYAQSYYAILFLEETYGHEKMKVLFSQREVGISLEGSFQKAFGITLEEFETEYTEWLGERLKTPPPDTSLVLEPSVVSEETPGSFAYLFLVICCFAGLFFLIGGGVIFGVVVLNKASKKE